MTRPAHETLYDTVCEIERAEASISATKPALRQAVHELIRLRNANARLETERDAMAGDLRAVGAVLAKWKGQDAGASHSDCVERLVARVAELEAGPPPEVGDLDARLALQKALGMDCGAPPIACTLDVLLAKVRELVRLRDAVARIPAHPAPLTTRGGLTVPDALRDSCAHVDIAEDVRHPDGSVDGRCTRCGARGFPIRDVPYERWQAAELGDPAVDDRLGYAPSVHRYQDDGHKYAGGCGAVLRNGGWSRRCGLPQSAHPVSDALTFLSPDAREAAAASVEFVVFEVQPR